MKRKRRGWLAIAGFLLLCLLWELPSLASDLLPGATASQMPALARQAIEFALLAAGASLFALARRAEWPSARRAMAWMVAGTGLFLVPSLLVHSAREWIGEFERVTLFSLTPVFAVVAEPYLGRETAELRSRSLLAALAAVAGTCLIFPLPTPGSLISAAGCVAVIAAALCIAVANCGAVLLAEEAQTMAPAIGLASGTAALGFALASALTEDIAWRQAAWQAGVAGMGWTVLPSTLATLLLFWLMRRMNAAAMTTRYVVAPLLANLIGLALLRPTVSPRAGLGLALVAAGAGWLLFARGGAEGNEPQGLRLD